MPTVYEQFINDLADAVAARINLNGAVEADEAPKSSRADSLAKARAAKAEKAAAAKAAAPVKKGGAKKAAPKAEPEVHIYTRDELEEMDREGVLAVAEEVGYELAAPKERTPTVINGILALFEADEDEEEAEEEEAEEAEAADGEEYWSREELEDKSLGELRKIAAEYDLDTKGVGKDGIIDLIMADE